MTEFKYLVVGGEYEEEYRFWETKEEAIADAKGMVAGTDLVIDIYKVKKVGCVYIPNPDPKVEWDE